MRNLLITDLLSDLYSTKYIDLQKSHEHLEWRGSSMVNLVEDFVHKNKLQDSRFIKGMNNIFNTSRFNFLLKKWVIEYFMKLFSILHDFPIYQRELVLADNLLNRFGVEKYHARFGVLPVIKWKKEPGLLRRIFSIFMRCGVIFYLSLNRGVKISGRLKRYKVMREALWGLHDTGGYFFHDDFFVDGKKIKKEGLLLYSRGYPVEEGRLKAYHEAKRSSYRHFDIKTLSLGIWPFFSRVIPKYIVLTSKLLLEEANSSYFSLYWSVYSCFMYNALPYEKVFSHFEVASELGHNYFSASHIAEAIICQNHGAKYYLMHWSDNSITINSFVLSFLGCDSFFIWGNAHANWMEQKSGIALPVGYVFKRFVKEVKAKREKILPEMGVRPEGKIVSFFDESFGANCKMTEENFVNFWETALRLSEKRPDITILMKPKTLSRCDSLSEGLKKRFIDIKTKMENMTNVYIMSSDRWSFIEAIGVADIVVTQGMTSSATIAIICGIQGLYLDEAQYNHPFSRLFKDRIAFDDSEKLLSMIGKIVDQKDNPSEDIPENLLRDFDAYPDERGMGLFLSILSGETRKKVGIIIQARMGSTRLPGKVMRLIDGKPILQILIERLRRSKRSDVLIVVTTTKRKDDVIEELVNRLGVVCFRGDEDDVLSRYYEAAKKHKLDVIVRVTSDCPLSDPALIDNLIDYYLDNNLNADYVANIIKRTYPRGFDIEVFSFKSLERAAKEAAQPYQREHVTPFISENVKVLNYEDKLDASKYRVTVDTIEDFNLIMKIFDFFKDNKEFSYRDVVDLLDSRPDLVEINQHIKQKEAISHK